MAAVQDAIMLFGDSITQGGWQPGLDGVGERLSREQYPHVISDTWVKLSSRCLRAKA